MFRKFIVIGDIHADFDIFWQALRSCGCATADLDPSLPVKRGFYQIVLIGDLVHLKSQLQHDQVIGTIYDYHNSEHQNKIAKYQIEGLRKIKKYQETASESVHIIYGNHDAAALHEDVILGTRGGVVHTEFDASRGGISLPSDLKKWFSGFLRELRVGRIQFTHVSPLPNHSFYDDLFYSDKSHKNWFLENPQYIRMADLDLGVYGHTYMERGVLYNEEYGLAMVDALNKRQFLEIIVTEPNYSMHSWRVVHF